MRWSSFIKGQHQSLYFRNLDASYDISLHLPKVHQPIRSICLHPYDGTTPPKATRYHGLPVHGAKDQSVPKGRSEYLGAHDGSTWFKYRFFRLKKQKKNLKRVCSWRVESMDFSLQIIFMCSTEVCIPREKLCDGGCFDMKVTS